MEHRQVLATTPGASSPVDTQLIDDHQLRVSGGGARTGIRAVALPLCLTLGLEAILIWTGSDTPSVIAVSAAVAGCAGLFFHLPLLSRPVIYWLLVAGLGVLLAVKAAVFPLEAMSQDFGIIPRTWTVAFAEYLICCQALLLWGRRPTEPLPAAFASLAIATSVCALHTILFPQTQTMFVLLATASLLLPALVMMVARSGSRFRSRPSLWHSLFRLATICGMVMLGTWCVADVWSRWLPNAQYWFIKTIGQTNYSHRALARYASSGSLTAIKSEMMRDPNRTALRVYCDQRPGYLAGRIFDAYVDGSWHIYSELEARRERKALLGIRNLDPLNPVPDDLAVLAGRLTTFALDRSASTSSLLPMKIENDPRRGLVYFTPLGCRYFQGLGRSLAVDSHDIVRGGASVSTPYVVFANSNARRQPLTQRQRLQLTRLPDGLDARVATMAQQICAEAAGIRAQIQAIRAFLQDNFQYSLDPVSIPQGKEPISHFLLSRQPAHCEFFASAAVTLLRLQGIPTRYVIGFRVMDLEEENGDYWIARNRNAHAWAEAFDDEQQRWVIVEATPGYADPAELEPATTNQLTNGEGGLTAQMLNKNNVSLFAYLAENLPIGVGGAIILLLTFAIGLSVFLRSLWRARSLHEFYDDKSAHSPRRELRQLLLRMDRRAKRRGLVRRPSETLHQFARRINSLEDDQDAWRRLYADWYRQYAGVRFGSPHQPLPSLPPKSASSSVGRHAARI